MLEHAHLLAGEVAIATSRERFLSEARVPHPVERAHVAPEVLKQPPHDPIAPAVYLYADVASVFLLDEVDAIGLDKAILKFYPHSHLGELLGRERLIDVYVIYFLYLVAGVAELLGEFSVVGE